MLSAARIGCSRPFTCRGGLRCSGLADFPQEILPHEDKSISHTHPVLFLGLMFVLGGQGVDFPLAFPPKARHASMFSADPPVEKPFRPYA